MENLLAFGGFVYPICPDTIQQVCKKLGFTINYDRFAEVLRAEIRL